MFFVFFLYSPRYQIKVEHGTHWLLAFYHNSTGGVFFENHNEAINCDGLQKYSILSEIDERFKFNNKFEFLLEYPGRAGSNRWVQTLNPLFDQERKGYKATGYANIWANWTVNSWGGLVKSLDSDCTLLDGAAGQTPFWWYSIGAICQFYTPAFPGPGVTVTQVRLWVRIPEKLLITPQRSFIFRSSMFVFLNILTIDQ